jgi:hypothetical protein
MKEIESELWPRFGSIEIGRRYEKRCANEDAKIETRSSLETRLVSAQ